MLLFKSRQDKINEIWLSNTVNSLKNQFSGALTVSKIGNTNDTENINERLRDNFTWGYIYRFIWAFLDTLDIPIEKKRRYEKQALKELFPNFGIDVMAEVLTKKDETIMFDLGKEYAEEDFRNWKENNVQAKKLGEFLIRGDKALNLDKI